MEEIRKRQVIWVYKVVSYKTGKIMRVLSRKYIDEFSENNSVRVLFYRCVGGYNSTGLYTKF